MTPAQHPYHPPFSPEDAWVLWNNLSSICDKLWAIYEDPFVGFCIKECEYAIPPCPQCDAPGITDSFPPE